MVKRITNDKLAEMINAGFNTTATKEDLRKLENKVDVLNNKVGELNNQVNKLEAGQSDIKDSLIPKLDFEDLESRVKYVETKLSIESGK